MGRYSRSLMSPCDPDDLGNVEPHPSGSLLPFPSGSVRLTPLLTLPCCVSALPHAHAPTVPSTPTSPAAEKSSLPTYPRPGCAHGWREPQRRRRGLPSHPWLPAHRGACGHTPSGRFTPSISPCPHRRLLSSEILIQKTERAEMPFRGFPFTCLHALPFPSGCWKRLYSGPAPSPASTVGHRKHGCETVPCLCRLFFLHTREPPSGHNL